MFFVTALQSSQMERLRMCFFFSVLFFLLLFLFPAYFYFVARIEWKHTHTRTHIYSKVEIGNHMLSSRAPSTLRN